MQVVTSYVFLCHTGRWQTVYIQCRKDPFAGSLTSQTNPKGEAFATEFVAGDDITLEYEPAASGEKARITGCETSSPVAGYKTMSGCSRIVSIPIEGGSDDLDRQYVHDRSCQRALECDLRQEFISLN